MSVQARPLVVGEAPGPAGPDERGPLGGAAGERIAALVGAPFITHAFDVVNLLPEYPGEEFPHEIAWASATMLEHYDRHKRVVLLGRNVARAFNLAYLTPLQEDQARDRHWLLLPHPSGLNRWWNNEANVNAARVALCLFAELEYAA